jgi:hypothetical protein
LQMQRQADWSSFRTMRERCAAPPWRELNLPLQLAGDDVSEFYLYRVSPHFVTRTPG